MTLIAPDEPVVAAPASAFPDPATRARPGIAGNACRMRDGREWLLAAYVPVPAAIWDDLFHANQLDGSYPAPLVRTCAWLLLIENYNLAPVEAAGLIDGADLADLARAVEDALFGPKREYITWSAWARAAFWSNGIDPDTVPAADRRLALAQLVATGRAVPVGEFTTAARQGNERAKVKALMAELRQTQPPAPPAQSP